MSGLTFSSTDIVTSPRTSSLPQLWRHVFLYWETELKRTMSSLNVTIVHMGGNAQNVFVLQIRTAVCISGVGNWKKKHEKLMVKAS